MRFSAPRAASPSPARRHRQPPQQSRRSTFGVPPDSSDEEEDSDTDDTESSVTSSSEESEEYVSEPENEKPPPRLRRRSRSTLQENEIEAMVASIRLRVTHQDAYEEWEHQTRKDAFISARHEQAELRAKQKEAQARLLAQTSSTRAALHQRQTEEVQAALNAFRTAQQKHENELRNAWKVRDQQLWQRIEGVIKLEEDKVKARLEEERRKKEEEERKKEEEERKKREEEERQRLEQERLLKEQLQKQKEEEERQKQKAQEEEQKRQQEEVEKARTEQEKSAVEERKTLGLTTAAEDWEHARVLLKKLKKGPMAKVKADKAMKATWGAGRREITPKLGQLTNDAQSISKITQQIIDIVKPKPEHPKPIYFALLSSLAKGILLQAETEVTAEKRSAIPLAQVTINLLAVLERFYDILWAKLCQRAGGWPVPFVIPSKDTDGELFTEETRLKALGYRSKEEGLTEFTARVAGMMRVYFLVLAGPHPQPLNPLFRSPKYWSYFARMLSQPQLLESPLSAELLSVALDVNGVNAKSIYGAQWMKMLEVLYEGSTTGLFGQPGKLIGGDTPEGKAARTRLQLEIERIIRA